MSSILTNTGAMVALQSLKSINSNLQKTQDQISTGKSVANAKDNSAVWAISKVMESDVSGFMAISSSLSLGESTVSVARQASETVTDLLTEMKAKIVASQEENVDRTKIQTDIKALANQIESVVGAAQFNGLNLLSKAEQKVGAGQVDILSSLDRSGAGVAASNITVDKQDLRTDKAAVTGTAINTAPATGNINSGMSGTALAVTALNGAGTPVTTTFTIAQVEMGHGYSIALSAGAGELATNFNTTTNNDIVYVAKEGDTVADVQTALVKAFNDYVTDFRGENPERTDVSSIAATAGASGLITITSAGATGNNFSVRASGFAAGANTIGGGLSDVSDIDVSSDYGSEKALAKVEAMIQSSIDSAASFGSAQGRIETQAKFISGLTDALKSGIGSLVDANMEEASARLQALQVQQQLGVQALSIANQAPQSILSLFR